MQAADPNPTKARLRHSNKVPAQVSSYLEPQPEHLVQHPLQEQHAGAFEANAKAEDTNLAITKLQTYHAEKCCWSRQ